MQTSFPGSVWDGSTPTRSASKFGEPTGTDWQRLVAEITATQQWLYDYFGKQYTQLAVTVPPADYTANQSGTGVLFNSLAPNIKSGFACLTVGPVNGDSFAQIQLQDSNDNVTWFDLTVSDVLDTEDTSTLITFNTTRKYVRGNLLVTGDDSDLNAMIIIGSGATPTIIGDSLSPKNYSDSANGNGVDFGVVDGKRCTAFTIVGALTTTSADFILQESDDNMTWFAISTTNVQDTANTINQYNFKRTRRYIRSNIAPTGTNINAAVLLGN